MKGIELPINALIIIVVAIVVLLAIIAVWFSGFSSFGTAVSLEGAKNEACRTLVQEKRCNANTKDIVIYTFDADKDGYVGWSVDTGSGFVLWTCGGAMANNGDNLLALCHCYYSMGSDAECKKFCGCP